MKVIHCDICGKEIKSDSPIAKIWDGELFYDMNDNPIEDVCDECFKIIYCCINMIKETEWKPDFHEKLNSDSVWDRDAAGYALSKLEDKTGLKF